MRITGLGHASVLIETAHGTVLTDPWVNPAYFGSWFPFPDNSQLDWDRIGQVDYLFVSPCIATISTRTTCEST
jgi:UDP-MurNAc hydroxylase